MEQTIEEDVVEEIKEQIVEEAAVTGATKDKEVSVIASPIVDVSPVIIPSNSQISFNDIDYIKGHDNTVISVDAPKTFERFALFISSIIKRTFSFSCSFAYFKASVKLPKFSL